MADIIQEASPPIEAAVEKLTKDLLLIRKEFHVLHAHVQSLSSQVLRLDRDLRTLSLRKVLH